jgi:hypothetical protein
MSKIQKLTMLQSIPSIPFTRSISSIRSEAENTTCSRTLPVLDTRNDDSTLTAGEVEWVFDNMAEYTRAKAQSKNNPNIAHLDILITSGAVSTLLDVRPKTNDIDIALWNLSPAQSEFFEYAAGFAEDQVHKKLHKYTIAGHTVFDDSYADGVATNIRGHLVRQAMAQAPLYANVKPITLRHKNGAKYTVNGGVTVRALPYQYMMARKLIVGSGLVPDGTPKPYDFQDAAGFLRRVLRAAGRNHIEASQINAWCREAGSAVPSRSIVKLNDAYAGLYCGEKPVVHHGRPISK